MQIQTEWLFHSLWAESNLECKGPMPKVCVFLFLFGRRGETERRRRERAMEGRRINRYRTPDMRCLQSIPSPKYNQVRKGFRP